MILPHRDGLRLSASWHSHVEYIYELVYALIIIYVCLLGNLYSSLVYEGWSNHGSGLLSWIADVSDL